MKKSLFTLLLIPLASLGQSLEDVQEKLMLIQNIDDISFPMNSSGYAELPDFNYHCEDDKSGTFWHVQDLNNDGLKDLIYSGPCKPYDQSAVFINDGVRLEKIFDAPGKLVKIEREGKATKLSIFKEGCCCDYSSGLVEVTVGFDGSVKRESISFHVDTELGLNKNLLWKSMTGIVRSQPLVDDKIYEEACLGHKVTGNQLFELKDEKVIVLQSKGEWSLVLCSKDDEHSVVGWVKQR